jgi:hypothetical protein
MSRDSDWHGTSAIRTKLVNFDGNDNDCIDDTTTTTTNHLAINAILSDTS